jgi:hypothetical protein
LILFFVLTHAAGLALTVWTIIRSGDRTQVLLYAFVLDYLFRLATVYVLSRQAPQLAPYLSSPSPKDGPALAPLRDEQSNEPIGYRGYALVTLALAAFAFVLANVDQHHELDADLPTVLDDLGWSVRLAAIYWLESLLARTTVLDPLASNEVNLAHNTQEIVVLACATLAAALVVVFRQAHNLGSSGWVLLGPLLAFRALFDFNAARRQLRRPIGDRS